MDLYSHPPQASMPFMAAHHCSEALRRQSYQEVALQQGREPGADSDPVGSNVFFRSLLFRIDGIRHLQAFLSSPVSRSDAELLMFFALGSAIDGHVGIAHGGFVATLLDNLLGFAAHLIVGHAGLFTVRLDVQYHSAIKTPGIIIGQANVIREKGRKVWTHAWFENDQGKKCAEAKCLFIKGKAPSSKM